MYGVPFFMSKIDGEFDFKHCSDPIQGIMKQYVIRDETGVHIYYEKNYKFDQNKILHLPIFNAKKTTKYLFFCHCPETKSKIHKDNYNCFLKNAWPDICDDNDFFICILLNVSDCFGYSWLSENTIVIRRPNSGLDFGAFTDGLHFTNLDVEQTKNQENLKFIFMNDTLMGPTIPWWIKKYNIKWTDIFFSMLNDQVKLAGITINPMNGIYPHVQSMLMVTDSIGLNIAMKAKVFVRRENKDDIILMSEIAFSTAILNNQFNIDCLAELLHGYDYRIKECIPKYLNDVVYDGKYAGFSIHPFETIFSKTNRMNYELSKLLLNHSIK